MIQVENTNSSMFSYGKTSVHVMKECVNSFQVAFAVPKNR